MNNTTPNSEISTDTKTELAALDDLYRQTRDPEIAAIIDIVRDVLAIFSNDLKGCVQFIDSGRPDEARSVLQEHLQAIENSSMSGDLEGGD